tara:strand:+ start:1017 stop:1760 length:744 start_codon:yes stop_codon:yes gene_type:complete
MSGHSKWSTIKRKKGAADAKRGVLFTRLSKDITLAARESGGDIEMNSSLRLAVKKAKESNMPSANIERAINKGIGNLPGFKYENYLYEGYGPNGVAIMMEVMTDNKNRTFPDIKHIMSKNGGNLGESGCVDWIFDKKGEIIIEKESLDEELFLEAVLDLDVEDIDLDNPDYYSIIVLPEKFDEVSLKLEQSNIKIEGSISLIPNNTIRIEGNDATQLLNLLSLLENHEDVQKVYSNFDIDDKDLDNI